MGTTGPTLFWPKGRIGSWLAVAAFGIAAQAILWSVSEPADLFSDFYKAYFPAADRLLTEGAVATWETTESAAVGFVNLPILAWLFVPLALLGEPAAGWAFLALGVVAIAVIYALLLRLGDFNVASGAMLALSILACGPLVNSLREGNTTHFILLLLVLALLLWRAGDEYAAGLRARPVRPVQAAADAVRALRAAARTLARGRRRRDRDHRSRTAVGGGVRARRSISTGTGTASSRSSAA